MIATVYDAGPCSWPRCGSPIRPGVDDVVRGVRGVAHAGHYDTDPRAERDEIALAERDAALAERDAALAAVDEREAVR